MTLLLKLEGLPESRLTVAMGLAPWIKRKVSAKLEVYSGRPSTCLPPPQGPSNLAWFHSDCNTLYIAHTTMLVGSRYGACPPLVAEEYQTGSQCCRPCPSMQHSIDFRWYGMYTGGTESMHFNARVCQPKAVHTVMSRCNTTALMKQGSA